MEKTNIYLFTNDSFRGASYGVGTYTSQLIDCLKNNSTIDLTLIRLFSQEKELKIEQEGNLKQIHIPQIKKAKMLRSEDFDYRYFRNATYLLKEIIPDKLNNVFHFQFISELHLISWVKKIFSGKIILTVHYTDWSFKLLGDKKRLNKILSTPVGQLESPIDKTIVDGIEQDKKVIQLCDKVICIAQHSYRSVLETTKVEKNKLCIISNGIKDTYRPLLEAQRNLLRKKYRINESQKIILFAGRLDEVKGLHYLIKSFQKLQVTHADTHLVVAGEGDFSKWFSQINNCWTKITFTGKLSKKQLYDWYKIADIGVSCPVYEEFGLVAIEMMMHALPLIVTDTGGLSEIIDDKINGLKVPVKRNKDKLVVDVNILVKQHQLLLDKSGFALELGKNARRKFLEEYQLIPFKKNMLNFYNNL